MKMPAFVYGIYDQQAGLLKIGYTTRPDYRYQMFGVGTKDHVTLLFTIKLSDANLARAFERLLHECLANARQAEPLRGSPTEWFRVELRHAQRVGSIASEFAKLVEKEPSSRYGLVLDAIDAARDARARVIRTVI